MLQRLKFPTLRDVSPLFVQVKWLVLRESYFVSVEYEQMGGGVAFFDWRLGYRRAFSRSGLSGFVRAKVLIE